MTRWPTGTFSSTPRCTSSSKPALTSSCQCTATGIGLCRVTGAASLSITSRKGGPDIMGSAWWVHVLNVLAAYRLFSHDSIAFRFSSVAGIGRPLGSGGAHGHGAGVAASSDAMTSPMVGNVSLIIPISMHAARVGRYDVGDSSCLVRYGPAVGTRESHHHRSDDRYPSLVRRSHRHVTGMRSSALSPILSATCMPIRQLWHPVSAIAGSSVVLTRFLSATPRAR